MTTSQIRKTNNYKVKEESKSTKGEGIKSSTKSDIVSFENTPRYHVCSGLLTKSIESLICEDYNNRINLIKFINKDIDKRLLKINNNQHDKDLEELLSKTIKIKEEANRLYMQCIALVRKKSYEISKTEVKKRDSIKLPEELSYDGFYYTFLVQIPTLI